MSPALQIANYTVNNIPKDFEYFIKDFIFMRRHKSITVQKPKLDFDVTDRSWYNPDKNNSSLNFFKTEQEEKEENLIKNKILLNRTLSDYRFSQQQNAQKTQHAGKKQNKTFTNQFDTIHEPKLSQGHDLLKRKIIKRVSKWIPNKQKQRKIQKMYCKYLLNYLHKSNLSLISQNIPPNLSVLQTIEDGDYMKDGQRKDYPHYSNVIQPIDLPSVNPQRVQIIRQPVRMDPHNFFFSIEQNTVFKVKHVFMLLQKIFEESINNCTMIREMNFKGDESLRLENENHNFEKLASMLGLNFQTTKLLFDILNDHYDLEKELALGRSDDYKTKVCQELKELLDKEIYEYFGKKRDQGQTNLYSCFTPVTEYYLSLKDLREIFLQVHTNK